MKLLIIQTNRIDSNGVTNVVFNYLNFMPSSCIQIDMVSKNEPAQVYKEVINRFNGKIFCIPRTGISFFKRLTFLKRLIKDNNYDIVHIHCNSHIVVPELYAAKRGGCKIRVVHSHNTSTSYPIIHILLTPMFNRLYTHGLSCGREAGKWMFGERVFNVINNGIDTERFMFDYSKRVTIRTQLKISDNDILIGHVGHFYGEVKNQQFLIRIFNELSTDKRYKLCLVGDGPNRHKIEQIAQDYNINNKVTFTGNIDNIEYFLNSFDIIIMPSIHEGLPLTLIEQQANGLVCICSDTITSEVDITGNIKFLSLQNSIKDWAEVVRESIEIGNREIRSKKAIKSIEDAGYSIQQESIKLLNFYNACINKA